MNSPLIRLRGVEKRVPLPGGQFYYLLRQITFDVQEGEFVSVMGPSGAGKSTLLHILGMQDAAWSGAYTFLDTDVGSLPQKARNTLRNQNVGFVYQQFYLLDDLTVYENLEIPLSYRDVRKSERQSLVCDLLDRFGIVAKRDLLPSQLSGGQQQLVAIARAIVARPKLLLADEPTGNLHSEQGESIMRLFQRLNAEESMTIIQVTHSDANAAYGHRVIRLQDGWMEKPPAGEVAATA